MAFIQFIAKFGKSYSSKEEIPRRFDNFKRAYKMIEVHNAREDASFTLAINKFADMDFSEINHGMMSSAAVIPKDHLGEPLKQVKYNPPSVAWHKTNKVAPVLDQGMCGSCWAFSATNSLESALAIKESRAVGTKTASV
jgi:hypothetical protein